MLRQRKKSSIKAVEVIKQLDSFTKVNKDDFVVRSRFGGTMSLIAQLIMLCIVYKEMMYYFFGNDVNFKFMPDTDYDTKLSLNLDLVVAMPCYSIGADILDSTSQNMNRFGKLEQEDTWFEMSPEQKTAFSDVQHMNAYLREEYHAINHLLWKSRHSFHNRGLPKRSVEPSYPPDACRIFGNLILNKVAGNLHVTVGKALSLPGGDGHVHFPTFMHRSEYNFSHRIHHLSFGESHVGIINPLDGDEKISHDHQLLYQYFIEVVPTDVELSFSRAKTYQYSVKDNMRIINHDKDSHGVPGIFFNYDISALKVVVHQSREPPLKFFVRLSSIVAGIFVSAGIMKDIIQYIMTKVEQFIDPSKKYKKTEPLIVSDEVIL